MTECCPCIKYRERGQSRERMAPVRGPGRSGRKPLGPTRPGCSASREIGGTSAECSALVPLRGPLRATVRPSVVPLRASARPGFLLPRSFAGAGGGRRGSVGPGRPSLPLGRSGGLGLPPPRLRPSPGSARPPHAPSPARPAGRARRVRGLGGVGRPWPAPCSLWSPCAALRPPPSPLWPLVGPPCAPPPAGAALRASGLLPPGGAGRALRARLSASAPPGVGRVPPSGQPGKGQARRPKAALAWPSCLRHVGAKPPKGGLDKLEHLCYYDGAGASRFPPPALCWT